MKVAVQDALNNFKVQMFDDGSFYEGSSCYHKLNLEMLDHVYILSYFLKIDLAEKSGLKEKANKLFLACSTKDSYLSIGDNDSAKFVFSSRLTKPEHCYKKIIVESFPEFGLVVAKSEKILISLRCFNYKKQLQPSGHFHDDQLSVSIKINGEDIFVDPGTGSYTSNASLRNYLRDSSSHSTFSIKSETNNFDQLFQNKIPKIFKSNIFVKNNIETDTITITGECTELHDEVLIERSRVVKIVKKIDTSGFESIEKIKIIDNIKASGKSSLFQKDIKILWNFILAPNFLVNNFGTKIFSTINLKKESSLFSESYLNVCVTQKLTGHIILTNRNRSKTVTTIIIPSKKKRF